MNMSQIPHPLKSQVLDHALLTISQHGWTEQVFQNSLTKTELSKAQATLLFPRGLIDLLSYFHIYHDWKMVEDLSEDENFQESGFTHKIRLAVQKRFELMQDHKIAVEKASHYFLVPHRHKESLQLIWSTSDTIWTLAGDPSIDYNWYTKRATLSAVYSSTLMYWLNQNGNSLQETYEFLDRTLE